MIIRDEARSDIPAITTVTQAAFKDMSVSQQTEAFIINALRNAGALTLSLVAEIEGDVKGHVAFSPVTLSDGTTEWYGLGPVSVLPQLQRQGIGTALITLGLARLREQGAQGCVLVGDPGYYERFGFVNSRTLTYPGAPREFFLSLPFGPHQPKGHVVFHDGFQATS